MSALFRLKRNPGTDSALQARLLVHKGSNQHLHVGHHAAICDRSQDADDRPYDQPIARLPGYASRHPCQCCRARYASKSRLTSLLLLNLTPCVALGPVYTPLQPASRPEEQMEGWGVGDIPLVGRNYLLRHRSISLTSQPITARTGGTARRDGRSLHLPRFGRLKRHDWADHPHQLRSVDRLGGLMSHLSGRAPTEGNDAKNT